MVSPDLCGEIKAELTRRFTMYDPVKLQREVHNAVDALVSLNRVVNSEGGNAFAVSALHAV
ncbi:MAG: hypothetical protein LBB89_08460 [Treponema sp.]|nr:hypothetical protein [Treponema sp.]